jgi:hypothetical protein
MCSVAWAGYISGSQCLWNENKPDVSQTIPDDVTMYICTIPHIQT